MKRERCDNKIYYAKHTFYEFLSTYCQKMVNRFLPVTLSKKKEGKSSRNIADRQPFTDSSFPITFYLLTGCVWRAWKETQ